MARQERYTIGPGLLRDIRETIRRVDALAPHTSGPTQGVRYWDMQRPQSSRLDVFKICTFTGSWSIGSTNTVTFGTAPDTSTAAAINLFFPLTTAGSRTGAVAKDGASWYLIDVPFQTATAVIVQGVSQQNVVTDVQISAVLNTSNCLITVSRTNTTASIAVVTSTATASIVRF